MPNPKDPAPDFSNVQSGSSSASASREEAMAPPQEETYTVEKGDTLSKIARRFYGDAKAWHRIHDANRDLIANPDLIHVGWVLKIPR